LILFVSYVPAGTGASRRAALVAIVFRISSRSSAFAWRMVAFAGSCASSVGAGSVMVVSGMVASPASIRTVFYVLFCMLDFNPAMSTSAFLTAMTMGVCAVAVSKFSMYLNRFL
jgi:hypothetical protein